MSTNTHRWRFVRSGGVDQVEIRDGADIDALGSLDQKLWVALACPAQGLEFDAKTLSFIDSDKDGRIRVPEILETIAWLKEALKDLDVLIEGGEELSLSRLNENTELGQDLLIAAKRVLDEQEPIKGRAGKIRFREVTLSEQHFAATQTAAADQSKTPDAKAAPKKVDIGTVAAIGVAVGGIATFFTSILALFFGLGPWMPLGLLALMLSISIPSMLIAWLKLRQRSLGPILDANGWAVNGFVRINVPLGGALTSVASIPLGSERNLRDPYREKGHPWALYLVLAALVGLAGLWYLGKIDRFLPAHLQSTSVLGHFAGGSEDALTGKEVATWTPFRDSLYESLGIHQRF